LTPIASRGSAIRHDKARSKVFIDRKRTKGRTVFLVFICTDTDYRKKLVLAWTRYDIIYNPMELAFPCITLDPRGCKATPKHDFYPWHCLPYKAYHGESTKGLAQIIERKTHDMSPDLFHDNPQAIAEIGKEKILLKIFRGIEKVVAPEGRNMGELIVREGQAAATRVNMNLEETVQICHGPPVTVNRGVTPPCS
jgi:hypothetical protein